MIMIYEDSREVAVVGGYTLFAWSRSFWDKATRYMVTERWSTWRGEGADRPLRPPAAEPELSKQASKNLAIRHAVESAMSWEKTARDAAERAPATSGGL